MKPEELATQFAEATLSFDQIIGQPTDSDIVRIFEALAQILLPVPYDEAHASHNLIGLVYSESEYTAEYVDPFVTPIKPGIYDTNIPEDANEGLRARMEAIHKAVRRDYGLYEAAERGARQFIIDVVEETYIRDLKHARLFYTRVKPIDFLNHLQATCGGLHAIDLLALQGSMQTAHKECDGIPEYIHTLEDAQAKAARANVPITDTMLMIIATNAMLQTEQYPRANDEWEDMPVIDHTWAKWKLLYRTAAKKAAIKAKATGGKDLFGSAHAATAAEEQSEDMNPHIGANLEGYFDNLAAAAMNEKEVLENLVKSMAKVTTANEVLTQSNATLTQQLAVMQARVCGIVPPTPPPPQAQPRAPRDRRRPAAAAPRARALCPNCNQEVVHPPADCFELPCNAAKRPRNWVSRM